MPTSLTLTYFAERYRHVATGREGFTAWRSREVAEMQGVHDTAAFERLGVDEVTVTYRHGQRVQVDAFGAWRDGMVTGLGKVKVKVRYQRNQQGTMAERMFTATQIRPWQAPGA